MERFIDKLKSMDFKGPLNIEREVPDQAERIRDVAMGVKLLEKLRG
jgi:sugar phosphate isomerase/epimerase